MWPSFGRRPLAAPAAIRADNPKKKRWTTRRAPEIPVERAFRRRARCRLPAPPQSIHAGASSNPCRAGDFVLRQARPARSSIGVRNRFPGRGRAILLPSRAVPVFVRSGPSLSQVGREVLGWPRVDDEPRPPASPAGGQWRRAGVSSLFSSFVRLSSSFYSGKTPARGKRFEFGPGGGGAVDGGGGREAGESFQFGAVRFGGKLIFPTICPPSSPLG